MNACAIVLAAGRGERMGTDKALCEIAGRSLVEHAVDTCRLGGVDAVVVVRHRGAALLPQAVTDRARVVTLAERGEMLDSLRAGLTAIPAHCDAMLVLPVDHGLAGHEAAATVLAQLRGKAKIALPLHGDRPGHPIALCADLRSEIEDPSLTSLRDVIRKDDGRVVVVPVHSPWVVRDLDTPADLAVARAGAVLTTMRAHRSRRHFESTPLPPGLLAELADAARHASTSSLIQAYALVAVEDADRKAAVARLCGDQQQIREAPVFVAVCADAHKLELACTRAGGAIDARSVELFVQATVDAALVGQNLLLAAESCGLGGCMIGAAREHPEELAALLELPRHCYVVFGMTIGHPTDAPLSRTRMPLDGILHAERYDDSAIAAALDGADQAMRNWAIRTNSIQGGYSGRPIDETKGWCDRMARLWRRRAPDEGGHGSYANRRIREALRARGFDLEH